MFSYLPCPKNYNIYSGPLLNQKQLNNKIAKPKEIKMIFVLLQFDYYRPDSESEAMGNIQWLNQKKLISVHFPPQAWKSLKYALASKYNPPPKNNDFLDCDLKVSVIDILGS